MRDLFPLDTAKENYETLKNQLECAENDLSIAIDNYRKLHQEHDQAWYNYVRYATPSNYDKFASALDALHFAHNRCEQSRLNYKLIRCKFKKASKLYAKLQKKEAKKEKQFGEE